MIECSRCGSQVRTEYSPHCCYPPDQPAPPPPKPLDDAERERIRRDTLRLDLRYGLDLALGATPPDPLGTVRRAEKYGRITEEQAAQFIRAIDDYQHRVLALITEITGEPDDGNVQESDSGKAETAHGSVRPER